LLVVEELNLNPSIIDTHAHLYSKEFLEDFDEVVARAKSNGLTKILLPNIDEGSIARMHLLSHDYPDFFVPMMGIHPCYIKKDWEKQLELVESYLSKPNNYCAIGEIGIDLHWDKTLEAEQKLAFTAQIKLAIKYQLPIVIHARESFDEIFEIVDRENCPELRGVFHCFTGTVDQAQHIINYGGFKMGIGGVVTFKNSGLDKVVAEIPLAYLVLETDCPYLPPVPYRGKRNESAYLKLIADKISDIHQLPLSQVAQVTTANAKEMFQLK
jgi:TatD DNase family protein